MQAPRIGQIVIFRDALGHDSPAIITATQKTLEDDLVGNGNLRALSSPEHVHLTIFTASTLHESGTTKGRDVPPAREDPAPKSTWRWRDTEIKLDWTKAQTTELTKLIDARIKRTLQTATRAAR